MLKGKVVLITGSSRGVGREIAKEFAMRGCTVIINYCTNKEAAEETIREIRRTFDKEFADVEYPPIYFPELKIIQADVSIERDVVRMMVEIEAEYGRIDILVNNAGIHRNAVSWKMTREKWDAVLGVNLTGAFLCIKHVIPIMRKKKWGRIINTSSVLGQTGAFGGSNYSASKAGLFGLTKSVAREVAKFGITVNCVVFGYADVGMTHTLPREIVDWVIEHTLLKRLATPEEFVGPICFLCTDEASYITGQLIHVNGGLYV